MTLEVEKNINKRLNNMMNEIKGIKNYLKLKKNNQESINGKINRKEEDQEEENSELQNNAAKNLFNETTKGKIKKMREAHNRGNINGKTAIAKTIGEHLNNTSKKGNDIMWYSTTEGQFKKGKLGSLVNNRPNQPDRYKINNAGVTQSSIAKTTLRKYNKNIEKI